MLYALKIVFYIAAGVIGCLLMLSASLFITVIGAGCVVLGAAVIVVIFACVAIREWWTQR